jgi:hypothetical protein
MPTRLGDLLDEATEHIVVLEDDGDLTCTVGRVPDGKECGRPATHDVIGMCPQGGGEWVRHWCSEHVATHHLFNLQCPAHPAYECAVRIVAVYPRRTS